MAPDMVQRFVVEVDSFKLLKQYLQIAMTTVLDAHEELAVKILDRTVEYFSLHLPSAVYNEKKHFPVILISGWYAPEEGKPYSYFHGYPKWTTFTTVDAAIEHIEDAFRRHREAWIKEFVFRFGDGYNEEFNRFDGSAGLGYELRNCYSFPEVLAISFVHMYYGK